MVGRSQRRTPKPKKQDQAVGKNGFPTVKSKPRGPNGFPQHTPYDARHAPYSPGDKR